MKMQEPVLVSDASPGPNYAVTLANVKEHLRIDGTDDDTFLNTLIAAAHDTLNGWNGETGKVLITQTWRTDFDTFPGSRRLDLPLGPVQSVTVAYYDGDNADQTFAAANYSAKEDAEGPYLWLDSGQSNWPGTYDREDAVRVTTVCGYGNNSTDVPGAIRMAMHHMIAHWYANREPVVVGSAPHTLPMAAEALLHNYRRNKF